MCCPLPFCFTNCFFSWAFPPQRFPTLLLLPEVSFCGYTLLLFPPICFSHQGVHFFVFAAVVFPLWFHLFFFSCWFLHFGSFLPVVSSCGCLPWVRHPSFLPEVSFCGFPRCLSVWPPLGCSPIVPPFVFTCDVFFPPVVCLLVVYPSVCFFFHVCVLSLVCLPVVFSLVFFFLLVCLPWVSLLWFLPFLFFSHFLVFHPF